MLNSWLLLIISRWIMMCNKAVFCLEVDIYKRLQLWFSSVCVIAWIQIKCRGRDYADRKSPICGRVPPPEMTFDCPILEIIFISDNFVQQTGFKLRVFVDQPTSGWQWMMYTCTTIISICHQLSCHLPLIYNRCNQFVFWQKSELKSCKMVNWSADCS